MLVQSKENQEKVEPYGGFWASESRRLREGGYTIKVRHERLFVRPVEIQSPVSDQVFVDTEERMATKGEFAKMIELKQIPEGKFYRGSDFELENNGGRTVISLFKDETLISTGEARVHPNDHFIRKLGLTKALAAALRNIKVE